MKALKNLNEKDMIIETSAKVCRAWKHREGRGVGGHALTIPRGGDAPRRGTYTEKEEGMHREGGMHSG